MSENMEIDCLVGEPLPGDLDATSYDVSIPEEFLVRDDRQVAREQVQRRRLRCAGSRGTLIFEDGKLP